MDDLPYLMTPTEIAHGFVFGHVDEVEEHRPTATSPRLALEQVILDAVRHSPCCVMFSGGRDSSTVLALATHVARREGLPAPIPVTRVFPDAPRTDEREWQEMVISHLDLQDWQRIEIHDELDIVGPIAARHLSAHGVVWPPTIAGDVPMLEVARGGALLDGEGGDNVLGVADHRIAPVHRVVRSPRPLARGRYRAALKALAPGAVRASLLAAQDPARAFSWLRPDTRAGLMDQMVAAERSRPLSYATSVRRVPRRRTQVLAARTSRALAEPFDVVTVSPLLAPSVVDALARDGGRLGRGDRSAVLSHLVGDLLPDALIRRTTKAVFTHAYMGRASRDFVASWDGSGVDPALVDPVELQRLWRAGTFPAPTAALLQQAWLAQRRPLEPTVKN